MQSWAAGLPAGRVKKTNFAIICNDEASVKVRNVIVEEGVNCLNCSLNNATSRPSVIECPWRALSQQPDGLPKLTDSFKRGIESHFPGLEFDWKVLSHQQYHSGRRPVTKYSLGLAIIPHSPSARPFAVNFLDD